MKKYDDVKRAADAALRGLVRTIYSNLSEEDSEKLCLELSMSLFSSTIDFSEPIEELIPKLAAKTTNYMMCLNDAIINAKSDVDKGAVDEDNII